MSAASLGARRSVGCDAQGGSIMDHVDALRREASRITRRRMLLGTAGAIGAAAFLNACGDDDDGASGGAATTAAGAAPSSARRRRPPAAGTTTAASIGRWRWRWWRPRRPARHRGGERRQGQDDRPRRRAGAHRHRLVLRQDDDARPRPRRQAHRRARRPDVQLHLPRPQVGRSGGRRPGDGRADRQGRPDEVRLLRRRHRGDAQPDDREQGLHARRRWRHGHLRPGQAVLLGHPGDHARTTPSPASSAGSRRTTRTRRRSA